MKKIVFNVENMDSELTAQIKELISNDMEIEINVKKNKNFNNIPLSLYGMGMGISMPPQFLPPNYLELKSLSESFNELEKERKTEERKTFSL